MSLLLALYKCNYCLHHHLRRRRHLHFFLFSMLSSFRHFCQVCWIFENVFITNIYKYFSCNMYNILLPWNLTMMLVHAFIMSSMLCLLGRQNLPLKAYCVYWRPPLVCSVEQGSLTVACLIWYMMIRTGLMLRLSPVQARCHCCLLHTSILSTLYWDCESLLCVLMATAGMFGRTRKLDHGLSHPTHDDL